MIEKKRQSGLGRGLSALLDEVSSSTADRGTTAAPTRLPLAQIVANPQQPRRQFDAAAMDELVASVRERGLLQPILVRPLPGGRYEVVAGERRWRAAQAAQLHEVPVVVRELDDSAAFEIALIENIQRVDLNAIEEAEGFARLMRDFGHTQEALAKLVGKARSHVANLLRLLDLPEAVRAMVIERKLTMGHARALVSAPDPVGLANRIIAEGLSVRATEALASASQPAAGTARAPRTKSRDAEMDANVIALENQLADAIGVPVSITMSTVDSGSVTLRFASLDQLDLISARVAGEALI
ncbi:ParB/RepB/Spo0J family partition protein [Polymorphobacter arshaanensis]|uniref:ParB/RepB/Spo0J family partition protein n=1 Tax=Glacieibacterium arshaanense TaxID=2511025 RepID=A0A4Y9EJG9_9SPHN|nr:ParB/RepB/Spo0J family partition protein [Polymorphobacter arshaanensis]TFU00337.1 ParB/RepB/Spo0J family partition protein [Polymorphobacter arshaanensis]